MDRTPLQIEQLLDSSPLVPVVTLSSTAQAEPLAEVFTLAGLSAIEVTLRTPVALDAIDILRRRFPDLVVGAGSVCSAVQFEAAITAGAQFLVSPGYTWELLAVAENHPQPYLPGAATPGEAMRLAERGWDLVKFFPAEAAGGVNYLAALAAPLSHIRFLPTGGITLANAEDYLALPNVLGVASTALAPDELIRPGAWSEIQATAETWVQTLGSGT